jgi:pyruvate kinase
MYIRKTKIVCTIGPASESPEMMRKLILGGMNVARLNFSHGTHEEHAARVNNLKKLRSELGRPIAILADTKGPEIRIKTFKEGPVELRPGQPFTITTREVEGTAEIVSVTYADFPGIIPVGARILLDDGLIELRAEKITDTDVVCTVVYGGPLSNRKGVNLPGIKTNLPYLDEHDKSDIKFAWENDFDYIALSFVRTARDVIRVKNYLEQFGSGRCELIAKIENAEGVENIDAILREADGIMIARGDLGVEVPFEKLPHIQKMLIHKSYTAGKKAITATQMLESMIWNPRPTRAEVTDIANAVVDGTSAIMLSGETAAGKHPVESLMAMVKIAEQTEKSIDYRDRINSFKNIMSRNITNAISHAACTTAHDLEAAAIVAVTLNGNTARMVSRFRPETVIVASTPLEKTYMQMALCWGVVPLLGKMLDSPEKIYKASVESTVKAGLVRDGDLIVVTGSSSEHSNITDTLQVHIIGTILASGKGIGGERVSSKACVLGKRIQSGNFSNGDILVIDETTNDICHMLNTAKGIVTEEDATESGAVEAAIALEIPVIAGVKNATKLITDGSEIILDPASGHIYNKGAVETEG